MMPIWTISARFFSPPEKPTLTGRLSISASMPSAAAWARASLMNSAPDRSGSPRARRCVLSASRRNWSDDTPGISTGYWKPRNSPAAARSCGSSASRSCPSKVTAAFGHLIARPPAEHIGQRRLARAVRPHDRMHLARGHGERQPVEDRLVGDGGVEVFNLEHQSSLSDVRRDRDDRSSIAAMTHRGDQRRRTSQLRRAQSHAITTAGPSTRGSRSFAARTIEPISDACPRRSSRTMLRRRPHRRVETQLDDRRRSASSRVAAHTAHHPTLPSRLIPSSFCASTANSIGSCFSTSRAKPLTISATAASGVEPARHGVEQLVVADLRRGRFMLDLRGRVLDLDVGHGVRAAFAAEQQAESHWVKLRTFSAPGSTRTSPR